MFGDTLSRHWIIVYNLSTSFVHSYEGIPKWQGWMNRMNLPTFLATWLRATRRFRRRGTSDMTEVLCIFIPEYSVRIPAWTGIYWHNIYLKPLNIIISFIVFRNTASKDKIIPSLQLLKHETMKAYGGVDVYLRPSWSLCYMEIFSDSRFPSLP